MIPMTHAEALNAIEGIKRLGGVTMSATVAYKVGRWRSALKDRVEGIEAARVVLVREHSTDGNQVDADKVEAFARAWSDFLGKSEPEPVHAVPLSIAAFKTSDGKEADVTPDMLTLLGSLVTE